MFPDFKPTVASAKLQLVDAEAPLLRARENLRQAAHGGSWNLDLVGTGLGGPRRGLSFQHRREMRWGAGSPSAFTVWGRVAISPQAAEKRAIRQNAIKCGVWRSPAENAAEQSASRPY
jgi:hypothetical protein